MRTSPASTSRRLAALVAAVLLAAGTTLLGAPSASANVRVEPCIWPATGTNLQQYFGVSSSLVIPPGGCDEVKAGSTWSTPVSFYVARTWEQVPAGYVPTQATPLDELVAHLTKIRLVVDEGTPQEFAVERSAPQIDVRIADWDEVYPDDPDWLFVDIGTHITMRPLPVGTHTVRGEFTMDAPACDGTNSVYDASCIPPGTFPYPDTRTFTVVPRG